MRATENAFGNENLKRFSHGVTTFDAGGGERMWVIGGGGPSACLNDVWVSNSDGTIWTCATTNAAFTGRYGHTVLVYNNKLWAISGYNDGEGEIPEVWYSSNGADWFLKTDSLPCYGQSHTGVVFDDKMRLSTKP